MRCFLVFSIYICTIERFKHLIYSLDFWISVPVIMALCDSFAVTTSDYNQLRQAASMVPDLTYISAPMVNQSDAPFRLLTRRYGATLTYTQMLDSHRLLNDPGYLHFHLRDLQSTHPDWDAYTRPVVVQLCGNDPEVTVSAARRVQAYCDGIGAGL